MMPPALPSALAAAWDRTDALFRLLAPEALLARPIRLRQPFIFYLGHLPAFGWNQVCRGVLGRPSFRPDLDALFERGIDPPDEDAPEAKGRDAWPAEAEVIAYRDRVRTALLAAIDEVARRADEHVLAEKGRIFQLVLEHELMHHETLLYMLHELPHASKRPPCDLARLGPDRPSLAIVERRWMEIVGGSVTLGAHFPESAFGWDNEFPEHRVDVARFAIESLPVQNRDFARFVEEGGYDREDLWTPDAWVWRTAKAVGHPHAWRRTGEGWVIRTMFEDVPFEAGADWPAYVSWAEARAYAHWRGTRLPTEAEFHRAARGTPGGEERPFPWGTDAPEPHRGNFDFRRWAPDAAGSHPAGASAWGVHEMVGNGWEWTGSAFGPFPGFEPYVCTYPGYSRDFFDGRHYVMLGASWATDAALIRGSFRNWYQPHYPYVFAKFRCVRDL